MARVTTAEKMKIIVIQRSTLATIQKDTAVRLTTVVVLIVVKIAEEEVHVGEMKDTQLDKNTKIIVQMTATGIRQRLRVVEAHAHTVAADLDKMIDTGKDALTEKEM